VSSSPPLAARSDASCGIEGTPAKAYDSGAILSFTLPDGFVAKLKDTSNHRTIGGRAPLHD
jgi:hypothetical protein